MLLGLVLAVVPAVHAQEGNGRGAVSLGLLTDAPLLTGQNEPVSARVRVENRTNAALVLTEHVVVPEGWRSFLPQDPFEVEPGQAVVRVVPVVTAREAGVEAHALIYEVYAEPSSEPGRGTASVPWATLDFEVGIRPHYGVHIETVSVPPHSIAGSVFQPVFAVTNEGNVAGRFRLHYEVRGLAGTSGPDSVVALGAGERGVIAPAIVIPGDLRQPSTVDVSAYVTLEEPEGVVPRERARATALVLPRLSGVGLAYHTFPLEIETGTGMLGAGQQARTGADGPAPVLQIHARGQSALRAGGRTRLGFTLRSPYLSASEVGLVAQDFYQVRVDHPTYALHLGDGSYRLSPLTSAYGFGAGGWVEPGRFRLGAVYLEDRFGFEDARSFGGEVGAEMLPHLTTKVSVLHREGRIGGDVVSLSTEYAPSRRFGGEAEVALAENALDRRGVSATLRFRGTLPGFSVNGHVSEYSAGYPNYSANQFQAFGAASARLGRGVDVRLSLGYTERGRLVPVVTPRDLRTLRGNATLLYARWLQLRYTGFRRASRTLGVSRGWQEDVLEVQARGRLGDVRLLGRVLGGWGEGQLAGEPRPVLGVGTGLAYAPSDRLDLSATADYTRGRAASSDPLGVASNANGTLRAQARLTPGTQLQLTASMAVYDDVRTTVSQSYQVGISHEFPGRHRLSFVSEHTRYSLGSGGGTGYSSAFLRYTLPLDVNLHRLRDTGLVRGTLRDAENGLGVGSAPVFLEVGGQVSGGAVTDEEGRFQLAEVPAGSHRIDVVTSSLAGEHLLLQGERVPVEVRGGEVTRIDLTVAAAAAVRVRVVTVEGEARGAARGTEAYASGTPVGGVAVELTGPDETLRSYTGASGWAEFGRLKPGTYVARLVGPVGTGAELVGPDTIGVRVVGGWEEAVVFPLRVKRRAVRFVSAETVTLTDQGQSEPVGGGRPHTYVVQPGEWLYQLALRFYGDADQWQTIWEANRSIIPDPGTIYPGQRLRLPPPK